MSDETLIEFPADIAVKAMGLNEDHFEAFISNLITPLLEQQAVTFTSLPSKGDKYLSVSIRFTATSLEQLHGIYAVLGAQARVLYTL